MSLIVYIWVTRIPPRNRDSVFDLMEKHDLPINLVCVGMAGSGKSSFLKALLDFLLEDESSSEPYTINLDPAVMESLYEPNIDIRQTISYQDLMSKYELGPNGAILTSLNLFASKFDAVQEAMKKQRHQVSHFLVDTPGQIEAFTWSASGKIICESLASIYPTVLAYVMDTPKCQSPTSFIANMLYACSVFYRHQIPMILIFNKIDECENNDAIEWMHDFMKFHEKVASEGDDNYISSFNQSLSTVLDEFIQAFPSVSVNSLTGEGIEDFLHQLDKVVGDLLPKYNVSLEGQMEDMQLEK